MPSDWFGLLGRQNDNLQSCWQGRKEEQEHFAGMLCSVWRWLLMSCLTPDVQGAVVNLRNPNPGQLHPAESTFGQQKRLHILPLACPWFSHWLILTWGTLTDRWVTARQFGQRLTGQLDFLGSFLPATRLKQHFGWLRSSVWLRQWSWPSSSFVCEICWLLWSLVSHRVPPSLLSLPCNWSGVCSVLEMSASTSYNSTSLEHPFFNKKIIYHFGMLKQTNKQNTS